MDNPQEPFAILSLDTVLNIDHDKLLLNSPRNAQDAHVSLWNATSCTTILTPVRQHHISPQLLAQQGLQTVEIPDCRFFLRADKSAIYPYNTTFSEGRHKPLVTLHTSGSSGIPKPIVLNHGTLSAVDAYQMIPSLGGEEIIGPSLQGKRLFLGFPLFHAAGVQYVFGQGVYNGVIIVFPPALGPMTAETVHRSLKVSKAVTAALPPSLVVDLQQDSDYHDQIRSLDSLVYAGGPLPDRTGHEVSQLTKLTMLVGSTEYPLAPLEPVNAQDWQYVKFSRYGGVFFRPQTDMEVYEQVFVRYEGLNLFQGIFATFPDLTEYSLKDLYKPHPTEPGLWRFHGRADDLIIFSTAEKLDPTDIESLIASHPAICTALVGGHGRSQPFLLVEPEDALRSSEEKTSFLNHIWAAVEHANNIAPSYGRIMKDFIVLTDEAKPPLRAGKGTVQRQATLHLYEEVIDDLYRHPELPHSKLLLDDTPVREESLTDALVRLVRKGAKMGDQPLPDTNLLDLGLDSWKAIAICKHVNAYLLQARPDLHVLTLQSVYEHPSVEGIEMAIKQVSHGIKSNNRCEQMQMIYDRYLSTLPNVPKKPESPSPKGMVVLLTGSSGTLGSYVLNELRERHPNATVYCLNRTSEAAEHHAASFRDKGLTPNFSNIKFLEGDINTPSLGLAASELDTLTRELTTVVHIAWKVDFTQPLDQYSDHDIPGVCNLLTLASKCNCPIQFNFVSSTSTITQSSTHPAPEQISYDWNGAERMGYAESKLVAERLIAAAATRNLIHANIARVGQIAGPTTPKGVWSPHEWFPTLIASSSLLNTLPETLGCHSLIDWIPVDIVSLTLVEIFLPQTTEIPHTTANDGSRHSHTLLPADSSIK
ncbi:MAG: hypothetical protein Q9183_003931, partial [Haloplaca sp. 2 TL-2023]